MSTWTDVYDEVVSAINDATGWPLFFRGHRDAKWTLMPTLARCKDTAVRKTGVRNVKEVEWNLYYGFVTRAGALLPATNDSWDNLFEMQHHGLPTRLLDWTECFGVALHFALMHASGDAAIWILDPYKLNREAFGADSIVQPTSFGSYFDLYIKPTMTMPKGAPAVAIYPLRHNPRIFSQQAGFTLHGDLDRPLEELFPSVVKKIVIPVDAQQKARTFLRLAGISEFSLFPDLDGLARDIAVLYT